MFLLVTFFTGALFLSFCTIAALTRSSRQEKAVNTRFKSLVLVNAPGRLPEEDSDELLRQPAAHGQMARLDALLDGFGFYPRFERLIRQSDRPTTPAKTIVKSVALAAGAFLLVKVFVSNTPVEAVAALVAGACPVLILRFYRGRRLKAFERELPDAIDLMSRALKAGHSLSSAIEVVAEQSQEPVASEFGEVFRSQNFGLPFRDAVLQLADRVPSKDLQFLVTAVMVQKETGGNLTEILDRTTHVIRERGRILGEVRTKTAQGRLTGWILSLLPVILGVLINIFNPGYAAPLLHDPLGQKMLCGGACLIAIGSFLISRIVKIEV